MAAEFNIANQQLQNLNSLTSLKIMEIKPDEILIGSNLDITERDSQEVIKLRQRVYWLTNNL
jgi:hypothetical protein